MNLGNVYFAWKINATIIMESKLFRTNLTYNSIHVSMRACKGHVQLHKCWQNSLPLGNLKLITLGFPFSSKVPVNHNFS